MLLNASLVMALVAANGFFVAAEFALVKVRAAEIQAIARNGSRTARLTAHIVSKLDAYLSGCQLGITLASLGLGWVGEPLVASSLGPLFDALGLPQSWAHAAALPVAFLLITFLHISIGEQVPKMLAIHRHMPTALAVSWPLMVFYRALQPLIWVLNASSNAMLRPLGIDVAASHSESPTADQLRLILGESTAGGHLTSKAQLMMENILDLEHKTARHIMMPRNQITFIDRNDSIDTKLSRLSDSGHSRLPLCDGDLDHVLGIIHAKDVLQAMIAPEPLTVLVTLARPPLYVPETASLDHLFIDFQRRQTAIALVIDEYGSVSGMVTLENVLESVVGPLQDEFDAEVPLIVKKGETGYEVEGLCPVDEVERRCGLTLPETQAATIGGLVLEILGRIPRIGEKVDIETHLIAVTEVEATRIRRLLIEVKPAADAKDKDQDDSQDEAA